MMADDRIVTVEPIDPLVFGDGRSIDTVGVARSRTLPPPTQLAGAVRTQAGSDDQGVWQPQRRDEVLRYQIHGPIGAILAVDGSVDDWWMPSPQDALLMRRRGEGDETEAHDRLVRLAPLRLPAGCAWGPSGNAVGMPVADLRKPDLPIPFWSWRHGLRPWLEGRGVEPEFAIPGPQPEVRTHVSLDRNGVAREGMLFGVTGIRFDTRVRRSPEGAAPQEWGGHRSDHRRHAMTFRTDAPLPDTWVRPMGGERRLARWSRCSEAWPALPDAVRESAAAGWLRLILVTPGAFTAGHRPRLDAEVRIVAQVNDRPISVSGWDFDARKPKPSRRLLPAGSVLFLELTHADSSARVAWAEETWLSPISDDPVDRRDGLGLALLGTWDGCIAEPSHFLGENP